MMAYWNKRTVAFGAADYTLDIGASLSREGMERSKRTLALAEAIARKEG